MRTSRVDPAGKAVRTVPMSFTYPRATGPATLTTPSMVIVSLARVASLADRPPEICTSGAVTVPATTSGVLMKVVRGEVPLMLRYTSPFFPTANSSAQDWPSAAPINTTTAQ